MPRSRSASGVMFAFRELLNARKDELARDPHLGARQGALRRARRDRPRHGGRRVRVRSRAPHEGRLLRERLDRHRRLHAPPAARRRRHHQPVQLPGDGAAVVLPDRDRGRQRRDPQAQREGPVGGELDGRAADARPACPTASSTSCTATRRRSTPCSTHPDVASISFVGSTPIAQYVYETATGHGKRVQALGGAKNHMLVLPDADLDLAADAAVNAGFGSAGERCMAISVVLAVDTVADELVEKVTERMATPHDRRRPRGCDMGPLITGQHRDKVASLHRHRAAADGATVVVDGRGRRARRRRRTASGSARR